MKFPILWTFDPTRPVFLEINISDYAVGAYLIQRDLKDDVRYSIGYYSRKIIFAELNYPIYNKKLLVIVDTFKV